MTPEQVASQQLWAAWVAAGAAVAQALGAIAAIVATVRLARGSERRASRLAEESVEREKAAEAAAMQRIEAADQAAVQREIAQVNGRRDAFLANIATWLHGIAMEYQEQIKALKKTREPWPQNIIGNFFPGKSASFRQLIPGLKEKAEEAETVWFLDNLDRSLAPPPDSAVGRPLTDYISELEKRQSGIENEIERLRELRL